MRSPSRRGRWLATGQDPRSVSDALMQVCANGAFPVPDAVMTRPSAKRPDTSLPPVFGIATKIGT